MRTASCSGILLFLLMLSCQDKSVDPPTDDTVPFDPVPTMTPLGTAIPEASGIADSYSRPGHLWVQEDSGNPSTLSLLSHQGTLAGTVFVPGVNNRDWEDLAIANGPDAGVHYVYLADIGNNNSTAADTRIIRFPEPQPGTDTIRNPVVIPFEYADGPRDAEAFLVDPVTHDIYLISKRDSLGRIYKLSYPYTGSNATASFVAELPYSGATSACINPAGTEILVKTYTNVYYYRKTAAESIPVALGRQAAEAPYTLEVQGEAMSFRTDDQGYFTLSEVAYNIAQKLYFYKRK